MKKFFRIVLFGVLGLVGLVIVAVVGLYIWTQVNWNRTFPKVPMVSLKASKDPKIIARGEYLFRAVIGCTSCHSQREAYIKKGSYAAPSGGEMDFRPLVLLHPPNITPDPRFGKQRLYTDAQLARILRYGVRPDHTAVMMKFAVGPMADQDLQAVISYLRTIKPVAKDPPKHKFSWYGKILVQLLAPYLREPRPNVLWKPPPFVKEGGVSVARGKYLAEGPSACYACHTTFEIQKRKVVFTVPYGGAPFGDRDPYDKSMEFYAPNLTPDPKTGHIASWTEEDFLKSFRKPRVYKGSFMPWESYKRMTDNDLRSIYRFLKTLKPHKRKVVPYVRAGTKQ